MKLITANKLNRFWHNGVLAKMVAKTKVLNTAEEIEANTSAENVTGALVAKELYNNLTSLNGGGQIEGIHIGEDEKPYITYKVGADTVTKKLGSSNIKLVATVCHSVNGSSYTFSKPIERGIIVSGGYGYSSGGSNYGFISSYTNVTVNKIIEKSYGIANLISAYEFTDAKAGSTVSFVPSDSAAVILEVD